MDAIDAVRAEGSLKEEIEEMFFTSEIIWRSDDAAPTYDEPRGGETGLFMVDVGPFSGDFPVLEIVVQHRNDNETTFEFAATFGRITLPGLYSVEVGGLKERVRLSLKLSAGNWVRFRTPVPIWKR